MALEDLANRDKPGLGLGERLPKVLVRRSRPYIGQVVRLSADLLRRTARPLAGCTRRYLSGYPPQCSPVYDVYDP